MYIDTHAHISKEYYNNIEEIITRAKSNNVHKIIINGTNKEDNKEVLELIDKYDALYGAIGFHPNELDNITEEDLNYLEIGLKHPKIVAIGEIGLDYHYEGYNKEKQIEMFKKQIEIAKRNNKPIIVHSRDSIEDTYNIIKEAGIGKNKCVLHCYAGSPEMAKKFMILGVSFGIGGIITYKNAHNIIKVIKEVPIEYLLLETDCPYLSPEPYRKCKNEPSFIPIIAEKISSIKGLNINDLEKKIEENTMSIFDI